jgi:hypothetical protein
MLRYEYIIPAGNVLVTTYVLYNCSPYSYRKRNIQRLLSLTDCFSWEDLPTTDPETGHLTKAGYIPIIQRLTKYVPASLIGYHVTQSTARILLSRDMVFTTWYPFDATVSPVYELANLTQVMYNFNIYRNSNLFKVCTTEKSPKRIRIMHLMLVMTVILLIVLLKSVFLI